MITKTEAGALIEEQVVREIFEDAQKESKALSLFRRLPNMSSDKTKLRVSDALPLAYFVDEKTNNGRKNLTTSAWKNVFITAEELAVIVPIKENLLNDVDVDLWAEIRPQLVSAIAKKIDEAVFRGEGAPQSWGDGIIPEIIAKGKTVTETGKLYSDINDTMTQVEESGFNVTALLGGVGLKGKFRMMTDTTGQPLASTEIGSLRREYLDNGAWDKNTATLIAGDFNNAVYSIRQDVTYKVLDQAVIQDPSTGEILYNLAQEDMVALRVTFRMGYAIPNPVTALDGTETRYPFAALVPEGTVSL
ncbi:MAG: phage major capsid protein [Clostridia bacterium]|nr:phage major capsid protein [Bacilli bacterium]MBR3672821.1 phage major capsid protein [Clostridia bacterium]